jgi:hypothetical protein
MWKLVLAIAQPVLSDLITNLEKKRLDAKSGTEITEAKITETEITKVIEKVLQKKHKEIEDEIEDTKQFISKVMSEIKTLSRRLPNLEVVNEQIRIFERNEEKNENFDQQQLTVQLKEQLEKALIARRREITRFSLPPEKEISQTPQIEVGVKNENLDPSSDPTIKVLTEIETGVSLAAEKEVLQTPPKELVNGENLALPSHQTIKVPEAKNPQPEERMSNYLENLSQYKEYGESILKGVTSFNKNQSLPDEVPPNLSKCLEDLEEAANKTIKRATSPVKIAIMGEISSGKTLLVGSLIGYADALPVNEIATTGNVTAIHLVQQEEEKTTKVDQFQVEYLSEQGVKECLDFMLLEAEKRAKAARLDFRQLEDLKKLSRTNPVDWNGILQWCEQTWNNTINVELRYLIRELVVFARSYNAYGKHICGKTYKIAQTTANEGLKLPEQPQNVPQMDFSSLPPVPQQWQNLAQPKAQELQNSFSLIRRIDTTAEISKQIWDLSGLKGSNEFVLLDLPGLGSENSGVRDTFLSLLEIKEVQTFLLLLNGRSSSPGQTAAKIHTMIQQHKGEDIKDRIIVGVGRFNQLPLNVAKEKELDELINDERPFAAPKSQEVLFNLDILKQTIISAEDLTTKKDTIVFLSQTFGLAKLAQESKLVEVCSPEFKPELDQVSKSDSDEYKLRQKWQKLGEMLLESEPRGTLGRQLSDFADDGGIGRLRSLLQEHVAEHGLKQLYEDTRSVAQQVLRPQQNNLKSILEKIRENPIPDNSPAYTDLWQAIDSLKTTYRGLVEDLNKQPLLKCNRVAVSDVVKDEISFRIHRWREWTVLFNSIQDGIIKPASATETAADNLLRRRSRDNNSIPTKSDDFYSTFEKTFEDLTHFVRDRTQDALQELLSELSDKIERQRHALEKIRHPQMEQQIERNFGNDAADLFCNLLQADDPKKWLDEIIKKINDVRPQTINSQTLFPLASKDNKHEFGQIFDWSSHKQFLASPRPFNHEFLLLRLRSEMVASASLNLADYVSRLTEEVNVQLLSILNALINVLLDLSNNELLLRYIATPDEQTNNPPWLQTLSQIPLISYPSL